ncbi:MAG: flippase-like domain-containing protein [Acidimicrobiaceae bacterium]|nr:flippase-like domain-containing protein [Acidimicrobiaceae bacterium]
MALTTFDPRAALPDDPSTGPAGAPALEREAWWRVSARAIGRHRRLAVAGAELGAGAVVVSMVGSKVPDLVSSVGKDVAKLRHPSLLALALALIAEVVALLAAALVPRFLLRRHGVPLGRRDAFAIGVAANGLAVVLPGGMVPSSVWLAHQLGRRGAPATLAAWCVLASGFASAVTLILLLLVGAGVAGVLSVPVMLGLLAFVVTGSASFLAVVHRVDRIGRWLAAHDSGGPGSAGLARRLLGRFASGAAEAATWRTGWRTGLAVLTAATVNWLADVGCLVAVFALVRTPLPWHSLLLAFAAGQLLGALVPLPGGLGAVEGGLVGTIVALGSPAAPVVVAVAVYRLVGYWLPAAAALPAYSWARRQVDAEAPGEPTPAAA